MEAAREALIIARHDLRHSIGSTRAILFLLIYALASVVAGAVMVWALSHIQAQIDAQIAALPIQQRPTDLAAEKAEAYRQILTMLVGDEDKAAYLTSIPIVVLFFFWGTRNFLPWLVVLMGYDQVNGEVHNRSIRYVLLRARRGSIVAGKMLSLFVLLMGLTIATNVLVLGLAAVIIEDFETISAVRHLARFWLLTMPIGLCWIAVTSFLSSLFKNPYVSLLVGLTVLVGTAVVGWTARIVDSLSFLQWVSPWHYGGYLLSHRPLEQLAGVAGFLGFAAVCTALSYLVLRWRDL
ncbi:MAG: ABC transporter permease [Myxococcota bacterium]